MFIRGEMPNKENGNNGYYICVGSYLCMLHHGYVFLQEIVCHNGDSHEF